VFVALPNGSEQTIFNPLIYNGMLIINTTIPSGTGSATSCKAVTDTADTIILGAATGAPVDQLFPNNGVGAQTNGSGTPFIALYGNEGYIVTQTTGGGKTGSKTGGGGSGPGGTPPPSPFQCTGPTCSKSFTPTGPGIATAGKRLTWIERR